MKLLWFLKRRRSGDEARERLKRIVGQGRSVSVRSGAIPVKEFKANAQRIKEEVMRWAVRTFKVDESKVKVEFQEKEGYVIIITNVSFQ